jgi:hypothetical protein
MATQTTESSLDELAKGLATGTLSRGKAIRWMGGALLGAALASLPGMAWADDCRRLGRECRRDSQCCSKNCVRWGDHKVCGCSEGKTRCKYRCVNLQTNERHCGRCGNRCAEGQECVDSVCQGGGCPPGRVELSNGTCAISCGTPGSPECGSCAGNCAESFEVRGTGYCYTTGSSDIPCSADSACPIGEFCSFTGAMGRCTAACPG